MYFHVLLIFVPVMTAFECYTCNDGPYDDDTKPCRDMKSMCPPGVTSCSMMVYRSPTNTHTRKFCSAKHTPLHQYLSLLPGSSICQNIHSVLENTMMNNIPKRRIPVRDDFLEDMPLAPERPQRQQPDNDLLKQMTDAGF